LESLDKKITKRVLKAVMIREGDYTYDVCDNIASALKADRKKERRKEREGICSILASRGLQEKSLSLFLPFKNKLKLNAVKTKCVVVKSVRKEQRGNVISRCSDGIQIEGIETTNYPGVVIDDKLRFKDHCDYMLEKIGKGTRFLNRTDNFVSAYTRLYISQS